MNIYLNGERRNWPEGQSLDDLVAQLVPSDRRVAVLHNGQVVSSDRRKTIFLAPDDRVELVTLAPGG